MNYDRNIDLHPYKVDGSIVRRSGYRFKDADAATFKPLNSNWALDANHVFSGTRILRGVNPKAFQVLNELYARDDQRIHFSCGVLTIADYESFRVLDPGYYFSDLGTIFEGYAQDARGVWHYANTIGKPRILKKADPATFEVLSYGYARDAKSVFTTAGLRINKADTASFQQLTERYARDRNHIFHGNTLLDGADHDSFEIVDAAKNQAKDKDHLYECHRRVEAYTSI